MTTFILVSHAVVAAIALILFTRYVPASNRAARAAAAVVIVLLILPYLWVRAGHMPSPGLAVPTMWMWLFFCAESCSWFYEAWAAIVMTTYSDHSSEADTYQRRLKSPTYTLPTVDIFIPTYNEPFHVVKKTLEHVLNLDYPRVLINVFLLDDGKWTQAKDDLSEPQRTEERQKFVERAYQLSQFCEQHGIRYLKRRCSKRAKAGNLRFGFRRSRGKYILVLDADFCVNSNFLFRTLGFLEFCSDVALVQTPQHFRNCDPIAMNLGLEEAIPEDQHFFMGHLQSCRDSANNAFCVGTSFVVRRAALTAVGGFPYRTVAEDVELSYALQENGKRVLFLNEALSYGLVPESILTFIGQRVRWCRGCIQHLFISSGPLLGRHGVVNRLFYLDPVAYWVSFLFVVAILIAPAVFWWTGWSAIPLTSGLVGVLVVRIVVRDILMYWLSFGKVPPFVAYVSRSITAFHISWCCIETLFRPFSRGFDVTDKDHERKEVVLRWGLLKLFGGLACATLIGVVFDPLGMQVSQSDTYAVNAAWSVVNVIILGFCAILCIEPPLAKTCLAPGQEIRQCNMKMVSGFLQRSTILVSQITQWLTAPRKSDVEDCRSQTEQGSVRKLS